MKKIKTLKQQGVSLITQARIILSAKYKYVIQADYNDYQTHLLSSDKAISIILFEKKGGEVSYLIGTTTESKELEREVTALVNDVFDIVHLLN